MWQTTNYRNSFWMFPVTAQSHVSYAKFRYYGMDSRDKKDSNNLRAFTSSRWLYDYREGHLRIKILCIDNITPYPLNFGLITLYGRFVSPKPFHFTFIWSLGNAYSNHLQVQNSSKHKSYLCMCYQIWILFLNYTDQSNILS